MKSTPRLTLAALALLAGTALVPAARAAIDLDNPATCYNAGNWYGYRSNTNVEYTATESSINFSKIDSSSYVWGYFNPVVLNVGDTLSFSGTFTFGTIASGGTFAAGLFNSGLCSQSEMPTHTYQSSTDVSKMANYIKNKGVTGTATGGMTGVSANNKNAYLRTNAASNTAFLSSSSGAQQTTTAFAASFSSPTANTAYAVTLGLTKTESGVDFAVSFGNESAKTISFETDISTFDVIGIRSPVTAGGGGITLSNFSIATAKKPLLPYGATNPMLRCFLWTKWNGWINFVRTPTSSSLNKPELRRIGEGKKSRTTISVHFENGGSDKFALCLSASRELSGAPWSPYSEVP